MTRRRLRQARGPAGQEETLAPAADAHPGATRAPLAPAPGRLGGRVWQWMVKLSAGVLIAAVRVYQLLLSPVLGGHCRFEPSCSVYFIEAVRKHGVLRGSWRGVKRILRCHPWDPGGYDPP